MCESLWQQCTGNNMENGVIEDERRNGLQRCQEFLGGAWTLATIDEFHIEYIP